MQIVIQHWCEEILKTSSKRENASLIQKYTGVKNYKARAVQRKQMMERITVENFTEMRERVRKMKDDDTVVGSSNFGKFLDFLTSDDEGWIDGINAGLDG